MSKEERKKLLEQLYRMVSEFDTERLDSASRISFVKIGNLVGSLCHAEGVDMLTIDRAVEATRQSQPLPIYTSAKPPSENFNERVESERKRLSGEI